MTPEEYRLLLHIDSPEDLKRLSAEELRAYCDELRRYIVDECSVNPGHLASSLGAVELAAALHYVFDTPADKIVWDVGHQTYAHKIITGRREAFKTKRRLGGISGFPRMSESEYDAFGGHQYDGCPPRGTADGNGPSGHGCPLGGADPRSPRSQ